MLQMEKWAGDRKTLQCSALEYFDRVGVDVQLLCYWYP